MKFSSIFLPQILNMPEFTLRMIKNKMKYRAIRYHQVEKVPSPIIVNREKICEKIIKFCFGFSLTLQYLCPELI